MKKLIYIYLFFYMPISVLGADNDVFTYTLENGVVMTFAVISEVKKTCQVGEVFVDYFIQNYKTAIPRNYTGDIIVPNSVNGYKVVKISNYAFSGCSLSSIQIPGSVIAIGMYAFRFCDNLKTVIISAGVKEIQYLAFEGCKSLQDIQFSYGLEYIGKSAFSGCNSITSVVIPSSVSTIEHDAFYGCDIPNITVDVGNETYDSRDNCNAIIETNSNKMILGGPNTVIPESVTCIGYDAFSYSKIESIVIPSSVKEIESGTFANCENLKELTIPASVNSIEVGVFRGCKKLTSVKLGEGLKYIGNEAFEYCDSLSSINIPEGVTSIGGGAFQDCGNLRYIVLPSTIEIIDHSAFGQCERLSFVISKKMNTPMGPYKDVDGSFTYAYYIFDNVENSILYVPKGAKEAYSKNGYWNKFGKIIEIDDVGIDNLTCSQPTVEYNGSNLTLISNNGATIYYTTDGSEPTINSPKYVSPIAVSGMCTIKAIAVMDDMIDSKVLVYPVPYYRDNEAIRIGVSGQLSEALEAYSLKESDKLTVCGRLNAEDVNAIRQMPALRELDLQDLSFETEKMPDEFLSDMNMVVCRIQPASDVKSIGKRLFKDCKRLASIIWNGWIPTSGVLAEIGNPNLLLYVTKADDAPYATTDGVANIVVNGYASTVTLVDNDAGNANFYCPEPFTAGRIQYTHRYEMATGYETCRGWETLALPFDVQSVEHESKGLLTPMIVNDQDKAPFWLYELTESGFVATDRIKANHPYIISMPNNMAYSNEYNLKGNVTFNAKDVSVSSTELIKSKEGNKLFVPCFEGKQQNPEIYVLNVNEAYGGYLEGSVFVQNQFQTKPFGAYMTVEGGNAPALIPLFDKGELTAIKDINSNMIQDNGSKYSTVYSLSGQRLIAPRKGINILDGKKVIAK